MPTQDSPSQSSPFCSSCPAAFCKVAQWIVALEKDSLAQILSLSPGLFTELWLEKEEEEKSLTPSPDHARRGWGTSRGCKASSCRWAQTALYPSPAHSLSQLVAWAERLLWPPGLPDPWPQATTELSHRNTFGKYETKPDWIHSTTQYYRDPMAFILQNRKEILFFSPGSYLATPNSWFCLH